MIHARKDYNRIQDPEHKIPDDEPVFLIRGQDIVAPEVVRQWAFRARKAGAKELIVEAALQQAEAMERWQRTHLRKIPDMPADVYLIPDSKE
ncbi:MAG: hypothetical protein M0Q12_00780 [Synergistaceae bacterium]|jgi:hypothetical protein|nr:hypothetical protein [Synergistaceae bacterium]